MSGTAQAEWLDAGIALAAGMSGVRAEQLRGAGRHASVARPRFAAIWALIELGESLTEVGRALGGRDHSTAINAVRRANELREADPAFRDLTDRLVAALPPRPAPEPFSPPARDDRPTGRELVAELKAEASRRGVDIEEFAGDLTQASLTIYLRDLERAERPRLPTIGRIRALIAGAALPPKQFYPHRTGGRAGRAVGDAPPPPDMMILDRSECGACGVRADLGCAHRPPSQPERFARG